MNRWTLTLFASPAALLGTSHAQQPVAELYGGTAGNWLGTSVADAGDVDGDGWDDLLVGAPGAWQERGVVYLFSGRHLAQGSAHALWISSISFLNFGDHFGQSIAAVGDATGDGVGDFVVGAPDTDVHIGSPISGAIYLIDGASLTVGPPVWSVVANSRFGYSVAACGDGDGDGRADVVVGAPGGAGDFVCVVSSSQLLSGGECTWGDIATITNGSAAASLGWSVAGGFDIDQDGTGEILIGEPHALTGTGEMKGSIRAYSISGGFVVLRGIVFGEDPGAHFGLSVAIAHDYDGDGILDPIVGVPGDDDGAVDKGRVLVLSGASFLAWAFQPIYDKRPTPNASTTGARFGSAVAASADLNGDGVGDFLVGGPGFGTSDGGRLWIYSGALGLPLGSYQGSAGEELGHAVLGGFDDLDGDGYREFAVASPQAPWVVPEQGTVKVMRLFPANEWVYCVGQTNSLGCAPAIHGSVGFASLSSPDSYWITATEVIAQKSGMLFYGYDKSNVPFHGGTLCVAPPLVRTSVQSSGGSATGDDCTGSFAFDFNDWLDLGVDPNLVVGRSVCAQYWSRDPQAAGTISLSEALGFLVNP